MGCSSLETREEPLLPGSTRKNPESSSSEESSSSFELSSSSSEAESSSSEEVPYSSDESSSSSELSSSSDLSSSSNLGSSSSSSSSNVIQLSSSGVSSSSSEQSSSSSNVIQLSSSGVSSSSSEQSSSSSEEMLSSSYVSSSSSEESSSSSTPSSSSTEISSSSSKPTCDSYDQDTHFCDARDSTLYEIVKIGNKTWMAENLKYNNSSGSSCYSNSTDNCNKYGRLYNWANNICPTGWKLPSTSELGSYVGHIKENYPKYLEQLGGYKHSSSADIDMYNYWWSNEEKSNNAATYIRVNSDGDIQYNDVAKTYSVSIRCIK